MAELSNTALTFIIVCPLVFLAGFIDAVAGGGGLVALPAYLLAGLPVHMAIGTNKLSSGMGTAMSTYRMSKAGNIPWKEAALCIAASLAGAFVGVRIALLLDDRVFKIVMLFILPVIAFVVFRVKDLGVSEREVSRRWTVVWSVIITFVVGTYDGFYGPGTGAFLILLLTLVAGRLLPEANGISKAVNLTTNITAMIMYIINGKVIFILGLVAGVCSVIGNYIGVTFFEKKGGAGVRLIMLIVIAIFFVRLIFELTGKV